MVKRDHAAGQGKRAEGGEGAVEKKGMKREDAGRMVQDRKKCRENGDLM